MNKQLILSERPYGEVNANTWQIKKSDIPTPGEGQIVVKVDS